MWPQTSSRVININITQHGKLVIWLIFNQWDICLPQKYFRGETTHLSIWGWINIPPSYPGPGGGVILNIWLLKKDQSYRSFGFIAHQLQPIYHWNQLKRVKTHYIIFRKLHYLGFVKNPSSQILSSIRHHFVNIPKKKKRPRWTRSAGLPKSWKKYSMISFWE